MARPFEVRPIPALKVRPPNVSAPYITIRREPADKELADLMRLIESDDEKFANRILTLRKTRLPYASYPEIITYDWLKVQGHPFTFQSEAFGGRKMHGGYVPDFVLPQGGVGLVWRVQGDYWHTRPGSRSNDLASKLRLMGTYINGLRIEVVVDLWETDIYRRRPLVFNMGLQGLEL